MIHFYNVTDNVYKDTETYIEEILDVGTDLYQVMFLVKIADLFSNVKEITAIRGRFAKDPKTGRQLLEEIAMTDDEEDFFNKTLKKAGAEVFMKLSAWAKQVDDAYRHDVTFDVVSLTDKYIIYCILLDPGWDINQLKGVDNSIEQALLHFILREWYKINRYMDEAQVEAMDYENEAQNIKSRLYQTKTPIRRPADIFEHPIKDQLPRIILPAATGSTKIHSFTTGPLVAGLNTVNHNKGWSIYSIEVVGAIAPAVVNPDDPTNAIDITVSVAVPQGLTIIIRGL